jgi:hypothetical protein
MMHLNNNNHLSDDSSISLSACKAWRRQDIDASRERAMSVFAAILSYGGWEKDQGGKDGGGLVSVEEARGFGVAEEACITSIVGVIEWVFGSKDRMVLIILTVVSKGWNPEDGRARAGAAEAWQWWRMLGRSSWCSGFVALTYLDLS